MLCVWVGQFFIRSEDDSSRFFWAFLQLKPLCADSLISLKPLCAFVGSVNSTVLIGYSLISLEPTLIIRLEWFYIAIDMLYESL